MVYFEKNYPFNGVFCRCNLHYEKFQDGIVKCIEHEIPFDVPEGWSWCRLYMVGTTNIGLTYKPTEVKETGTIVLRSCNIKNGKMDFTDLVRVHADIREDQYIYDNDILICARNGSRSLVGKCAIMQNLTEAASFGAFMAVFRSICNQYVYHYFNTSLFRNSFDNDDSKQINQVTQAILRDTLIPLPPFAEQNRIVAKLHEILSLVDFVNDGIDQIETIIANTKRRILDLAIRGKLVPQDPNDEPASILLERIIAEKEELIKAGKIKRDKKESIIFKGDDNSYYEKYGDSIIEITDEIPFELPYNCIFVRFKDIWELLSGRDLAPNNYNNQEKGIPYITGASNFINSVVTISRWTDSPQVITKLGDLLITCKGTVGEIAFNTFGNAYIARQIMTIRNIYNLNIEYLSLCISFYIESLKTVAKGLIPGISRDDILNLILPLPSEKYQASVVSHVNELFKIIDSTKKGESVNTDF